MPTYIPPTAADLEQLKTELGLSSSQMAHLFALASGRQWRRYLSEDKQNQREMGLHMLFFAMAHLELDKRRSNGCWIACAQQAQ